MVKHLDGIKQVLVIYPYVVEGGFTVDDKLAGNDRTTAGFVRTPTPTQYPAIDIANARANGLLVQFLAAPNQAVRARPEVDAENDPRDHPIPVSPFAIVPVRARPAPESVHDPEAIAAILRVQRASRSAAPRGKALDGQAVSCLMCSRQVCGSRPSPGSFSSAKRTMPSLSTRYVPRLAKPVASLNTP